MNTYSCFTFVQQNLTEHCKTIIIQKKKPSEDLEPKPFIFYIPWIEAEWGAIVKDFPKVTEYFHRFAQGLNKVIQTHQPSLSELYWLAHVLIDEGRDQHWMKTTGKVLEDHQNFDCSAY